MTDRTFEVIGDVISTNDVIPSTMVNEEKIKENDSNMTEDPTVFGDDVNDKGNGITPCMINPNPNL